MVFRGLLELAKISRHRGPQQAEIVRLLLAITSGSGMSVLSLQNSGSESDWSFNEYMVYF